MPVDATRSPGGLASRVVPALDLRPGELGCWRQLCAGTPHLCNPFLSPEFTQAIAFCHERVYVAVIGREGEPAGFLPFQFPTPWARLLRAAVPAGDELSGDFGLVANPTLKVNPRELLRLSGLSYLGFGSTLDAAQTTYGLAGETAETRHMMRLTGDMPYWDGLLSRDRKLAAEVDRHGRRLEVETGPVRFCLHDSSPQALANLIEHKRRQYARSGGTDIFTDPRNLRLFDRLAALQSATCSAVLSTLHAGRVWIASHFGLRCGNLLCYYMPVYNTEFGRYSPGHLLLKALAAAGPSAGIEYVDFGAGQNRYKVRFGNHSRLCYRGAWWMPGVRSFLHRAACSIQWRLSARAGNRLEGRVPSGETRHA